MSRTTQRRQSAFKLGFEDGKSGLEFRYHHHPFKAAYAKGYWEGRAIWLELHPVEPFHIRWVRLILNKYFGSKG